MAKPHLGSSMQQVSRGSNSRRTAWISGVTPTASWLIAVSVFLSLSKIQNHFGILVQARVVLIAMVLAILSLATTTARWRPSDVWKQPATRLVCILAAIAVLGVPFGITPGRSFAFLNESFSRTLIVAFSAWALARTAVGVQMLARTVTLATIATGLFALYLGRTDSDGRLAGAYAYDPNDLSLIANVSIPLVLWWLTSSRSPLRWLLLPWLPLAVWIIIQTGSRGGFLGLVCVLSCFTAISLHKAPNKIRRLGVAVVVVGVLAVPLMPADYVERIGTIFNPEEDYNVSSETGRLQIWQRGIGYALRFPVFGVGIANFNWAEGTISELAQRRMPGEGLKFSTAHNSYVQALAELGLVGGFVFAILVVRTTWQLVFWFRRHPERSVALDSAGYLLPYLGVAFVGFASTAFFLSFAYYDILYVLVALASGAMSVAATDTERAAGAGRRVPTAHLYRPRVGLPMPRRAS